MMRYQVMPFLLPLIIFVNSTLAEPFVIQFDGSFSSTGDGSISSNFTLRVTVDNGGSSTEGQTWDLNDFVSASLNAGSYSAQFSSAPSDFLFQTDGSGTLTAARIQSLAGLATEDSLNGAVGVDFSSNNGYMRDSNSGLSFISAGDVQNLTQVAVTTGFTGPMRNDSPCAPAWTYSPSIYPGIIWEEVSMTHLATDKDGGAVFVLLATVALPPDPSLIVYYNVAERFVWLDDRGNEKYLSSWNYVEQHESPVLSGGMGVRTEAPDLILHGSGQGMVCVDLSHQIPVTNAVPIPDGFNLRWEGERDTDYPGGGLYTWDSGLNQLTRWELRSRSEAETLVSGLVSGASVGNIVLSWPSAVGKSYVVQKALSITSPDWSDYSPPLSGTGSPLTWNTPLNTSNQYYRVREE